MATYYVATTGNDTTGTGSLATPWATVTKALATMAGGDTVYLRGGSYSGVTLGATHSGTVGNVKTVRAYAGEQAVFTSRCVFNTGSAYVEFIGHDDVRIGRTADTIRFQNATNSQHVIEYYGTGHLIRGCDIDHEGGYLGSCVAMGYQGAAGQYRAIDCIVTYCLVQDIGIDPSLGLTDSGHDHGVYSNYNLNCEVSYNLIKNILGGWGIHHYSESTSARHVDDIETHHNTVVNTRDGGIILASDGTSTTQNCAIDNNLCVDCGNAALTKASYSYDVFWGGPVGTGNTGTGNHSHNPADGHVRSPLPGWTLAAPSTGDPLFINSGAGDYRLNPASPALGKGALGIGPVDPRPPTYGFNSSARLGASMLGVMRLANDDGSTPAILGQIAVKLSGVFETKPVLVKLAGVFTERPLTPV